MSFLYWIGGLLVLIWLIGVVLQIGGTLIYWALVIGLVLFVIGLFSGRRAR